MNTNRTSAVAPIFIGGMFKSGTSLLRAMVGRHSQVAAGLETYWFELDWSALSSPATTERLRVLRELFDFTPHEFTELLQHSTCAEDLLDLLMREWAARQGKPRWAEKTPGNVAHMDRIVAHWPDAHIVHIVRDPRDVFASLREAHKWDTVPEFMDRWGPIFRAVEQFRSGGRFSAQRYLEVRYEQLVNDPDACMRRIWEFAGLPHEPETAVFPGQEEDFYKVKRVTGRESTTLARLATPMTQERHGIWRTVLQAPDVQQLERAAEERGLATAFQRACGRSGE